MFSITRIRSTVRVGRSAKASLPAERVPDSNVESRRDGEGNEDPEIVGKQTQTLIFGIDPALRGSGLH